MVATQPGWYWCRLVNACPEHDTLYIFQYYGKDEGWQVFDTIYDDDAIQVIAGPIEPPKEIQ